LQENGKKKGRYGAGSIFFGGGKMYHTGGYKMEKVIFQDPIVCLFGNTYTESSSSGG
jgi:hypothetical protein